MAVRIKSAFAKAAAILGAGIAMTAFTALPAQADSNERTLSFKIALGVDPDGQIKYESPDVTTITYYQNRDYIPEALGQLNVLLRDRRQGALSPNGVDRALLDLLNDLQHALKAKEPNREIVFHVISGYRSAETNAAIREDKDNAYRAAVARGSAHIEAKAADIFVPGVQGTELRDAAWCLGKGGVGAYPQFKGIFPFDYVHVDSRGKRYWGFDAAKVKCPAPGTKR